MTDGKPRIDCIERGTACMVCRKGLLLTVIAHRRRNAVDRLARMGAREADGVPEASTIGRR